MENNQFYNNKDELRTRKQPSSTEKEVQGAIDSNLRDIHQGYRKERSDTKFLKAALNIIFITIGILSIILLTNSIRSLKSPNSNIEDELNPTIDEGHVLDKAFFCFTFNLSQSSIGCSLVISDTCLME